ncbi:GNAT family N-acetyltransferase [Nocardia violaceofusca]|uniref:GNAT family N-acetyltransferase n=1 Tax=Nocardia violaceofusca TaxID=941182 RepID=UPI000A649713|nr:hypothetical protein [Nocardia violaceofusca]
MTNTSSAGSRCVTISTSTCAGPATSASASARPRGLAGWALGRMLDHAHQLGMDRLLLVCAVDNVASAKTIQSQGGVFEGIRDTALGPARRYWITLPHPSN